MCIYNRQPKFGDHWLVIHKNKTLFLYFQNTGEKITEEDLSRKIHELGGKGEKIMTILEAREQQGIERGIARGIEEGIEKGIEEGIVKGLEKGRLEGLLLGRRETAKNFLRMGLSPEQVAKAAELPLKEILQFKKEIEN